MDVEAVLDAATRAVALRARGRRADVPRVPDVPLLRPPHRRADDEARLPHRRGDRALARARPDRGDGAATRPGRAGADRRGGRVAARRGRRVRPREPAAGPCRRARLRLRERPAPAEGGSRPDDAGSLPARARQGAPRRDGRRPERLRRSARTSGPRCAASPEGLLDEFGPDRVLDMPISEQMFTGFATGAALAGRRCVVEYQIPSLLYLAFEQIANQAQKLRLMTGGQAKVPGRLPRPGVGRAARARRPALRPPVLAFRPRGSEDGAALDAGRCVRADARRDPRRRPGALPRAGGGAAAARRAAGGCRRRCRSEAAASTGAART